jgi:pimeloyl-ACP methyl ester carboxylesterase
MEHAADPPPHFTHDAPRLACWLAGTEGPPVLLVMGYGMRGDVWRPQIDALERDHRVCWYDHRGVGRSEDGRGPTTMRVLAEDALRVMDRARFERAHVVGVSMGGMVSQELALRAPERVASLALIATHAGGPTAFLPTPRGVACFVRAQTRDPAARVRALTSLLYPDEFIARCARGTLESRMRASVGARAKRRTLLHQLAAIALHDTRDRLGRISAPTLVVRPGLDVLVRPSGSDEIARRIAGARTLRIEDAGHGCIFQSAGPIAEALRAHFRAAHREPAPREAEVG